LAADQLAAPSGSSLQTRLSLSNFESYTEANAPQLTYGYPIMTMAAMYSSFFAGSWTRVCVNGAKYIILKSPIGRHITQQKIQCRARPVANHE
jgi:hypothetical protein